MDESQRRASEGMWNLLLRLLPPFLLLELICLPCEELNDLRIRCMQRDRDAVIEPNKRFHSALGIIRTRWRPCHKEVWMWPFVYGFHNEVTFVLGMRHEDTHNLPWPASFQMRCLCTYTYIHTHPHSHISTLIRENASLFISILSVMRSRPMCHWAWARTRAAAQLV